jgi:hypothetical protein
VQVIFASNSPFLLEFMQDTLKVLLQLRDEGAIGKFAIGGAVAASAYVEAIATEDLDVFAFLQPTSGGLLVLTPLYERLKAFGGVVENEHVVLHGWPVQILPAYNPLVEAAVSSAAEKMFHDVVVPVVTPEYLCAIALQTGRAKDYQRVNTLLESGLVNAQVLEKLILDYALSERWGQYVRRYS